MSALGSQFEAPIAWSWAGCRLTTGTGTGCGTVQTRVGVSPTFRVAILLRAAETTVTIIDASILAPDLSDRSDDPIESAKHSLVESTDQISADNERSERNIRMWSSYLPPECVNTMIRMGWDRTT
jgi:hypothetical protein